MAVTPPRVMPGNWDVCPAVDTGVGVSDVLSRRPAIFGQFDGESDAPGDNSDGGGQVRRSRQWATRRTGKCDTAAPASTTAGSEN